MSFEITTAFVDSFKSNVIHLTQQRGSRLGGLCRREDITGKRHAFERIGATQARKRTSRHSDTPQIDTPHSRRWVSMADYDWADLIDDEDKARLLISPESEYAQEGAWAMGRSIDDVIITALDGTAYEGADGTSTSSFPSAQSVAVDFVESGSAANSNLTVGKLRQAADIFGTNDVDEEIPRVMIVTQSQLTALLKTTEVTSEDYNVVKALVTGKVDTFMGFKFIRTQRLPKATNTRSCFAMAAGPMGAMGLVVGRNPVVRMSERDDKNYALQVFMSMTIGATRIEDEKIVRIYCDETA